MRDSTRVKEHAIDDDNYYGPLTTSKSNFASVSSPFGGFGSGSGLGTNKLKNSHEYIESRNLKSKMFELKKRKKSVSNLIYL